MTDTQKEVIENIINDPMINADKLSNKVGVTKRTIERAISFLQKEGIIQRVGSKKSGSWRVIK